MFRIMVFSPQDQFLDELSPNDVFQARIRERINEEHALTITTSMHLEKEQRILTSDHMGKWREFVVTGTDRAHEEGRRPYGEYRCVWSLQHDLNLFDVTPWYDAEEMITARTALNVILSATSRWSVGTVTRDVTAGAAMYQISAWQGLQTLVKVWGGEVDVTIEVGVDGITGRKVNLYEAMGEQTAKRRFDYGADMTSMRRKVDEIPWACGVRPFGKSYNTIDDLKIKEDIRECNHGIDYLLDDEMVPILRLPDGNGGWEYPIVDIENSDLDDPELIMEWALEVMHEYTRPKITYETNVSQYAAAGMDVQGVALGDAVQCVDRKLTSEGVRLENRVVEQEIDLIDPTMTTLTLGDKGTSFALTIGGAISSMRSQMSDMSADVRSTSEYLDNILDNLNEAINATGGYTYITPGQGIRTYNKAVTDPLVGAEADAVVEMKGGTIRIANSKTAQGEWQWRTVFVAGHIASDLVTAAQLTAGFIGNRSGSYWDLDNDVLQIASTASIGTKTVTELLEAVRATITGVDTDIEYNQNQSRTNPPSQDDSGWSTTAPAWREGWYIWQRTKSVVTTEAGDSTSYSAPTCISGRDGSGVVVSSVSYGTSSSASTEPTNWSATAPTSIAQGTWLWVLTTYSDNSTTTSKSYVGTNGTNGTSVTITKIEYGTSTSASTEPSSWSTTSPTSLTNGTWLWVRTTYSNGSTATNKSYVGTNGENGVGITSIVEQYYLSTSSSSQTGGSWSSTQPTWESGKYIWTRSYITWDNGDTSTTTPILAGALNSANQTAKDARDAATEAAKVATNYLTFASNTGLDVGYSGTNAKTRINGSGLEVFDGDGVSALFAGLQNGASIVRAGRASGSGNVVMSSEGYVDVRNASTVMAHFGYGDGKNSSGGTSKAPYYDIGIRKSGTTVGNYSVAEGNNTTASGYISHAEGSGSTASGFVSHAEGISCIASGDDSHAEGGGTTASDNEAHAEGSSTNATAWAAHSEGYGTTASGSYAHAEGSNTNATKWGSHSEGYGTTASGNYAHAEGYNTTASGEAAHAEGYGTTASGKHSHATGWGTKASGDDQFVCGSYNSNSSSNLFEVGTGNTEQARRTSFAVAGIVIRMFSSSSTGTVYVNGSSVHSSDRRRKDHVAYLGEDAIEFVRALRPVRYRWKGEEAEHYGFYAQDVQEADPNDTATVVEDEDDGSLGFDPLSLDYTALIAPLTAYAQQLERRIERLESALQEAGIQC